ncbi:UPF0184 protein CG14818 [Stomoxys calcitrans]|uniref:Uncharacterized protein n=1 Tax=Stomoxys calcitrans TaxID=35570 RepID=A0A1I8Q5D0_STOCA|nr:UPF0184 protein CG14818 [Stomoxys calcitrans]
MNMSPRNNDDPSEKPQKNVGEDDIQEMEAVNNSLDELSSALDFFEQRTDDIIEQLKELLHSNREIRQELAMENAATGVDNLNLEKKDT